MKKTLKIKLFLLILVFCSGNSLLLSSTSKLTSLPQIFKPLTWNIDIDNIDKLFPDGKISHGKYNKKIEGIDNKQNFVTSIRLNKFKFFGETLIALEHDKKIVKRITIATMESRQQCNNHIHKKIPDWCRNNYTTEISNIFRKLKSILTQKYGKPTFIGQPIDIYDKRAKEVIWNKKEYIISISILNGEEEQDWSVSLNAIRN